MSLKEQYPTLAADGLDDSMIRRVLTSRGYSGRIGSNTHRVTELLYAAKGDVKRAELLIDQHYPAAFTRSNGSVPTKTRLYDTCGWSRTREDVQRAIEREQRRSGVQEEPPASSSVPSSPAEPPVPEAPVLDRSWRLATLAVGQYPYLMLYGPPGTGKTALAIRTLRERFERVVNLYITPETTAAELMGYSAPDETGNFVWRDGPVTVAMRNGLPLVINEIDDVGGDAETALLGVLDDQDIAQYELMSGETVRPAPGFTVVATMNGKPDSLRPALADRFPMRIEITTAHPDAIERLPEDLREAARKSVATKDPAQRHSLRAWLAFAVARDKWGYSEQDAAYLVWQDRAQDMLNAIKMGRR